MLSESRKKLKWSTDPHNLNWANDDSKFGMKMMEKMGWSKGKGLGANENGSLDNVKVRVKNNTRGLGASKAYENSWIAHQDDFASLLSNLNDNHNSVKGEEKKPGKDLSQYKDNDIAAIFGQKTHSAPPSPKRQDTGVKIGSEIPHVKSELSIQEYFEKRMKNKRKKEKSVENSNEIAEETVEKKIKTEKDEQINDNNDDTEVTKPKKKKKNKKRDKGKEL